MSKWLVVSAAVLLMAACTDNARDPGFVCMSDCAHECPDGIKGDSCRKDLQMQRHENGDRKDFPDESQDGSYPY
ncbi:MAG TPA: hypothetical protein VFR09_05165 [Alphaproteobacteria bacterium]|nr:hypothetical protein [Alphaproteobacteria bacterium]